MTLKTAKKPKVTIVKKLSSAAIKRIGRLQATDEMLKTEEEEQE
jgi:hypothetical protein